MSKKLTNQRQAFVEHYLMCWNATEAAKRAGYSVRTANEQGARLLANVSVQMAVAARIGELKATADEVLLRLASHSRGSMDDFLGAGESLSIEQARARGMMHLVKKYKVTTHELIGDTFTRSVELELYDAQAATVQLAKILGLFVERIEIRDWRERARAQGYDPDALVAQFKQLIIEGKKALTDAGNAA